MKHLCVLKLALTLLLLALQFACGNDPEAETQRLFKAVKADDLPQVVESIKKGAKVNEPERGTVYTDWTPLHFAAFYGNPDIVKALLDGGANPNAEGRVPTRMQLAVEPLGLAKSGLSFAPQAEANPKALTEDSPVVAWSRVRKPGSTAKYTATVKLLESKPKQ